MAFQNIQSQTCIRFVPRKNQEERYINLKITTTNRCAYAQSGGGNVVFKANDKYCTSWSTMVHKLMHSLQFSHEHERIDRGNWMKIDPGCGNIKIDINGNYIIQQGLYDYKSLTHYFCNHCRKPLASREGVNTCGSDNGLSVLDVDRINSFYDCKGCLGYRWKPGKKAENGFAGGYSTDHSKLCLQSILYGEYNSRFWKIECWMLDKLWGKKIFCE